MIFGGDIAEEICNKRLYYFRCIVKQMHEYYAQKTEKFITQLRHAMRQHSEVSKYRLIS